MGVTALMKLVEQVGVTGCDAETLSRCLSPTNARPTVRLYVDGSYAVHIGCLEMNRHPDHGRYDAQSVGTTASNALCSRISSLQRYVDIEACTVFIDGVAPKRKTFERQRRSKGARRPRLSCEERSTAMNIMTATMPSVIQPLTSVKSGIIRAGSSANIAAPIASGMNDTTHPWILPMAVRSGVIPVIS